MNERMEIVTMLETWLSTLHVADPRLPTVAISAHDAIQLERAIIHAVQFLRDEQDVFERFFRLR